MHLSVVVVWLKSKVNCILTYSKHIKIYKVYKVFLIFFFIKVTIKDGFLVFFFFLQLVETAPHYDVPIILALLPL